ncbi:CAP domain-containing protein [Nodularia sp. UHCC 0506]|uniref:CAP domain-containing protein n=1 Tax=Nodularia sp. UHCC 0506 TaxID=3110243 RepID=UPI002B21FE0E|nr:CAP domain-containing protein [Nodularia sp. UHCC 0506]MEA5515820.1 CAP domain-containing protein [Nodularia sp. UHCC 0506]
MKNQLSQILWFIGAAMTLVVTGCEQLVESLPPLPRVEIPSGKSPQPLPPTQSATTNQMEIAIRQRINEVRQDEGLQPLEHNEKLAQVARNYSRQMAEKNFFSHTGNDGSTLQDRVQASGMIYWVVGENLFKSTNVPQPVKVAVDGWMESPGHRENILRPVFIETGVGVWRVNNTYYITQLFMRR